MLQRAHTENRRGMWKGALIGGAVGAAAALLLAPKSGKELRGDIRDRYNDVSDRTKQMLAEAGSKTQDIAKQVGAKTHDIAKQVGQQASDIMDKTRSAVTAAKDEMKSWKDEREEGVKDESKVN